MEEGSEENQKTLRCKVVVVGNAACGKSALVRMLESGGSHFPQAYNLTPGVSLHFATKAFSPDSETAFKACPAVTSDMLTPASHRNNLPFDHTLQVELFVHDCGGHELFRETTRRGWPGAHAVVVAVDLTEPDALDTCDSWLSEVNSAADRNLPAVLVGTKLDDNERRAIDSADMEAAAERMRCPYFECSALPPGKGIHEPFQRIAQEFGTAYERHLQAHSLG